MTTDVSKVLDAGRTETATGNQAGEISNVKTKGQVDFILDVTAASGTTPTLVVTIEGRDPASQKYIAIISFASIAVVGNERISVAGLADTNIRVSWVITGGTPSFTFTVGMVAKDD